MCILAFKAIHGLTPTYLTSLVSVKRSSMYSPRRNNVQFQKISIPPPPHGRSMEIPRGRGTKRRKFPRGWGCPYEEFLQRVRKFTNNRKQVRKLSFDITEKFIVIIQMKSSATDAGLSLEAGYRRSSGGCESSSHRLLGHVNVNKYFKNITLKMFTAYPLLSTNKVDKILHTLVLRICV